MTEPRPARPDAAPVLVIGLDGAAPELIFDRWRADLPVLDELMRRGVHGPLESTVPAITVPAWSSMMTGRDPGQLGIYGFRNRLDRSYERLGIATALDVRHPRVWDHLSADGRRVATIGVPQTYPIKPVNGHVVSCFLTPNDRSQFAFPASLRAEIKSWIPGEFLVDVPNFRSDDKDQILRDIYTLADQHFDVARRLLARERYDYFMLVDMGVDRIHHGYWRYMDPGHPRHEPGHRFEHAIHDYYVHVDRLIGGLLDLVPAETVVLVVSDHGGQAMQGGLGINEWLVEDGYLGVDAYPVPGSEPMALEKCGIDWNRTRAWGEGGYYGRLSMNVAGREPAGQVPASDYEAVRSHLAAQVEALGGPDGQPLGSHAFRPEEIYREVQGVPPDLILYFGDLTWRSVGKLGLGSRWTTENDTGPDDANHAQHGIFILADPRRAATDRALENLRIYDVAPTLLAMFGLEAPDGIRGRHMELPA